MLLSDFIHAGADIFHPDRNLKFLHKSVPTAYVLNKLAIEIVSVNPMQKKKV